MEQEKTKEQDFKEAKEEQTSNEQRIRKITQLYYSNPNIQKAIFEFSKNREVVPRYFEGFGKRPDAFEYIGDVFELVKNGATSFHCSQEIWFQPLSIVTGMTEKQFNDSLTEGSKKGLEPKPWCECHNRNPCPIDTELNS